LEDWPVWPHVFSFLSSVALLVVVPLIPDPGTAFLMAVMTLFLIKRLFQTDLSVTISMQARTQLGIGVGDRNHNPAL
jgi:hypothetical protein